MFVISLSLADAVILLARSFPRTRRDTDIRFRVRSSAYERGCEEAEEYEYGDLRQGCARGDG